MSTALSNTRAGSATLSEDYSLVRRASANLVAALEPEDCVVQTIPEVSPTKWHLAHVTWFFETFCLVEYVPGYRVFDERYRYLFNSYYYSVGAMHARNRRGILTRPPLREVLAYRAHVDEAMLKLIETSADETLAFRVALGLNHEQQHQELMLTDIKHVFATNPLEPAYANPRARRAPGACELAFVARPGGTFAIGARGTEFCFDNETPRHDVLVGEHALANRLVTNREYREFVEADGYADSRLWLADGWSRVQSEAWSRPLYWSQDLETEFTLNGRRPIDPDAPVCHVSFYEADAFARFASARLPLEAEWELAASRTNVNGNTLDSGCMHPQPVSAADDAPHGLHQLWGDVWEWTSSPYAPYPRFAPLEGSLGEYNGKFMANQMVVRGGSCATWASHLRPSYRSFFYPHDRWQFLGFRLARDLP